MAMFSISEGYLVVIPVEKSSEDDMLFFDNIVEAAASYIMYDDMKKGDVDMYRVYLSNKIKRIRVVDSVDVEAEEIYRVAYENHGRVQAYIVAMKI